MCGHHCMSNHDNRNAMSISELIKRDLIRTEMINDILAMEGNKKIDRALIRDLVTILEDEFAEDEKYAEAI